MMRNLLLVALISFAFTIKGQNPYFKNISQFHLQLENNKSILLYSHHNGCAPCRRMDSEVLSLSNVREFLDTNFVSYEVFGYDSLQSKFRKQYAIVGDPTFLFLDRQGKETHRIAGFFDAEDFIAECKKPHTSASIVYLDSVYSMGSYSLNFLREYVHATERARMLDSLIIFQYLDFIPDSNLLDRAYFVDVLDYGYYTGNWDQPLDSRYYKVIKEAYSKNIYPEYREEMRTRLAISVNHELYISDSHDEVFDSLLAEMRIYENGNMIAMKDLHSSGFFVFLQDRYPSFGYEYERAKKGIVNKNPTTIFEKHAKACWNNSDELNALAWGIYEDEYDESIKLGIKLVKRAIEIQEKYSFLDTYAALLYKYGKLDDARKMANYAIEVAKEKNKDFSDTEKLLEKIEEADKK